MRFGVGDRGDDIDITYRPGQKKLLLPVGFPASHRLVALEIDTTEHCERPSHAVEYSENSWRVFLGGTLDVMLIATSQLA